jgi:hypothetical protein
MMVLFTYLAASGSGFLQKLVARTEIIKKVSAVLLMAAGTFVIVYVLFLESTLGALFTF